MPKLGPIPITGAAVCNALGTDWESVREALNGGRTGLTPCEIPLPFSTYAGAIPGVLPDLPPVLGGWQTRAAQVAFLMASQLEAPLQRARERWQPHRIGVLLGTSTAGADATEDAYKQFIQTGALPDEYDLWRHHTYGAVLHVVRELTGATGPAWMVSTACTSSAKVIASAKRMMEADVIDAAIVGGVDTLCAMTLSGFYSLGALSEELCRPFSADRKGINIGEGGAFLLMERTGDAQALIEGVGESSDAYHVSAPHPDGLGAETAMQRALADAGCAAADVDHVNAHGTGTRLNDSAEGKAVARVFGAELPVVSTKGYTGHTLGGAGATEAAFAMMAIETGTVPCALRVEPLDDALEIHVPTTPLVQKVQRVVSNSFAFGGNNISVVVRGA